MPHLMKNSHLFLIGIRMNKAKAKGTAFETAVVRFLADETGAWVERRALSGTNDKGDLIGDGLYSSTLLLMVARVLAIYKIRALP